MFSGIRRHEFERPYLGQDRTMTMRPFATACDFQDLRN
jgi:hypothetical protein